jgi:hypothetical protein
MQCDPDTSATQSTCPESKALHENAHSHPIKIPPIFLTVLLPDASIHSQRMRQRRGIYSDTAETLAFNLTLQTACQADPSGARACAGALDRRPRAARGSRIAVRARFAAREMPNAMHKREFLVVEELDECTGLEADESGRVKAFEAAFNDTVRRAQDFWKAQSSDSAALSSACQALHGMG